MFVGAKHRTTGCHVNGCVSFSNIAAKYEELFKVCEVSIIFLYFCKEKATWGLAFWVPKGFYRQIVIERKEHGTRKTCEAVHEALQQDAACGSHDTL